MLKHYNLYNSSFIYAFKPNNTQLIFFNQYLKMLCKVAVSSNVATSVMPKKEAKYLTKNLSCATGEFAELLSTNNNYFQTGLIKCL